MQHDNTVIYIKNWIILEYFGAVLRNRSYVKMWDVFGSLLNMPVISPATQTLQAISLIFLFGIEKERCFISLAATFI